MGGWRFTMAGVLVIGALAWVPDSRLAAQCDTGAHFGYPSQAGCPTGRGGTLGHNWQQSHAEARAQAEKVFLRNQAWPKPFDCWDRQSYFATWNQFYDAGLCAELTLLDAHFENQTDQLNSFGIRRLAAIVSSNSSDRLAVFIARTNNEQLNQSRVNQVRLAVGRILGSADGTLVAVSEQDIVPLSGRYHSTVNELRTQQTPPPIISIGPQSSLSGAVNGN